MNNEKLIRCFQAVFPKLSPEQVLTISAETLEAWDSVAMVNLMNLVSEEFEIEVDWENLDKMTSYAAVHEMVAAQTT